jgi:hypothetical protein
MAVHHRKAKDCQQWQASFNGRHFSARGRKCVPEVGFSLTYLLTRVESFMPGKRLNTWVCCFTPGYVVSHLGMLFHTWVCCFTPGMLFHTWVCCFTPGYVFHIWVCFSHLGMLFHTWVCCFIPGYVVSYLGMLFHTWVCCFTPGYIFTPG